MFLTKAHPSTPLLSPFPSWAGQTLPPAGRVWEGWVWGCGVVGTGALVCPRATWSAPLNLFSGLCDQITLRCSRGPSMWVASSGCLWSSIARGKKAAEMRGLFSFGEFLGSTSGVVTHAFRPSGLPAAFLFMERLSFSGKLWGPHDGCAVLAHLPSASMAGVGACAHSPPVPPTQIMSPLLPPFS